MGIVARKVQKTANKLILLVATGVGLHRILQSATNRSVQKVHGHAFCERSERLHGTWRLPTEIMQEKLRLKLKTTSRYIADVLSKRNGATVHLWLLFGRLYCVLKHHSKRNAGGEPQFPIAIYRHRHLQQHSILSMAPMMAPAPNGVGCGPNFGAGMSLQASKAVSFRDPAGMKSQRKRCNGLGASTEVSDMIRSSTEKGTLGNDASHTVTVCSVGNVSESTVATARAAAGESPGFQHFDRRFEQRGN